MCTVCGCGEGETRIEGHTLSHKNELSHEQGKSHEHGSSPHNHDHKHSHYHDYGQSLAHAHAPGLSQSRMVQIETDILSKNNEYAAHNRRWFSEHKILTLNLVSSPGSGKTSLLTRTIDDLNKELTLAVVEGDQQTDNDAQRIRETGVKALQINTGKGCHLDAHMIGHAIDSLELEDKSILFIENVGNLVCPAAFDLGEAHKVAILSVTEGDDKPLKYPDMFHAADLLLLNKTDLLPYVNFDVEKCSDYARQMNPGIKVIKVSATTGEGMDTWYQWIKATQNLALI